MRQQRWPDHALSPKVAASASYGVRNSQLLTVGHPEYLSELLREARHAGDETAKEVAEHVLRFEIGTTQHEARAEIVAQCNQLLRDLGALEDSRGGVDA